MQVKFMAGCALGMLGEQVDSLWRIPIDEGSYLDRFAKTDSRGMILILIIPYFAGDDLWIGEDELVDMFMALSEGKRTVLWSAMKDICAVGGWIR